MACKNCLKDNEELFNHSTSIFKSRQSLVVFLLNVVLNIKDLWESYCYSEKVSEKCSLCQFKMIYWNDQYAIYENSFNMDFLVRFYSHMERNLWRLLKIDSHIPCELVSRQFYYIHKDWFSGQVERFYIPYCLDIYENDKMNSIKNNEFKFVIDPCPLKKYLFAEKIMINIFFL